MDPMQSGSKFTDRITKYLTKSAERKTTRASKSKGHVIPSGLAVFQLSFTLFHHLLWSSVDPTISYVP